MQARGHRTITKRINKVKNIVGDTNMNNQKMISRLMHHAFVDIRAQNVDKDPKSFHLADLFHNIPIQLEDVAEGAKTSDEIWEWLNNRAEQKGEATQQWLASRLELVEAELEQIDKMSSDDAHRDETS
jgi:hypothetical protein